MSLLDKAREKLMGKYRSDNPDAEAPEDKPIMNPDDQDPKDIELASWVRKKLEKARSNSNRVAHEALWLSNCATVLGYDNVYFNTQTRQFNTLQPGTGLTRTNRLNSNQVLSACQNRLARLCKTAPKWEIRPSGNSPEDRDRARLQYDILIDLWEKLQINQKRILLTQWKQQVGHCYFHVCYDDTLGKPLIDPVEGIEVGKEGNLRIDVVPAFEVFPEPLAKNWWELTYLFRAKARPLKYFRDTYGDLGKAVKSEGSWLQSLDYEQRINSLTNFGPGFAGTNQDVFENTAVEVAYYEKPCSEYPKGRMVITASGILLKNEELPVGEIPFVKFDDIMVAGKFYPESPVTHARPLQQQYNRDLGKAAKFVNTLLAGKYLSEKRHGLAKEALNDTTEVVEYDHVPGAPPPEAVTPPQLPQYYFNHTQQLKSEIYEQFGLSEVSRGQLPAAGIPAVGMQLLVEQDETRIGIEVEHDEHCYAQLGSLILKYGAEFFKTKRQLKVRDKTGQYNVREYDGKDIGSDIDVSVVRGSTVPTSRALRRQEIMNAYQQGLLGAPQDPTVQQQVLGMLEFGDVTEMWKKRSLDMAQIEFTIEQIEKGIIPEVNELDNHPLHIQEKNDFRKSDRCRQMPEPLQQLLMDDINRHIEAQMRLQNPGLFQEQDQVQSDLAAQEQMGNTGDVAETGEMPENNLNAPPPPEPALSA